MIKECGEAGMLIGKYQYIQGKFHSLWSVPVTPLITWARSACFYYK